MRGALTSTSAMPSCHCVITCERYLKNIIWEFDSHGVTILWASRQTLLNQVNEYRVFLVSFNYFRRWTCACFHNTCQSFPTGIAKLDVAQRQSALGTQRQALPLYHAKINCNAGRGFVFRLFFLRVQLTLTRRESSHESVARHATDS